MIDFSDDNEFELTPRKKKESQDDGAEGQLTVDIFQDEDDIIIQSTIAGVQPDDLDISITNDMVTIKGRRHPPAKISAANYYYRELHWGPFSRSVILPAEIDVDDAKASIKNGMLTIRPPKHERLRTRRIKISD